MPFKKGYTPYNKGKHHLEETKKKLSDIHKKIIHTPEWNRNSAMAKIGIKRKSPSEETRKKLSIALIGNTRTLGYKHSEETKKKMSESRKRLMTPELKQRIRDYQIAHPHKKSKDTGIELKIEAELRKRNINYQKQVPLYGIACVDFFLPDFNAAIEADGDYWHNRPGVPEKDLVKTMMIQVSGTTVYRFWEHEINKSASECLDRIPFHNLKFSYKINYKCDIIYRYGREI